MSSQYNNINSKKDLEQLNVQVLQGEAFDIPSRYQLVELRGKGSYGVVCSAKDATTGEMIAIKKNKQVFPVYVSSQNCDEDDDDIVMIANDIPHRSETSQTRILRELKILLHLNHPNIISLKDVILPRSLNEFSDVYVVTDLMEADLRDIIDSKQDLTDAHIQYFMYQMILALVYMHSADILHRDIKPENILLNSNCELKLCDFGLSKGLDFENEKFPRMSTAYVQTRWYRAPELLLSNHHVTKEVDMWSIGCIFAELLGRRVLFPGSNPVNQLQRIVQVLGTPDVSDIKAGDEQGVQFVLSSIPFSKGYDFKQLFPDANPLAVDLLKKMLHFNPEKRMSASNALKHPYFKSIYDPAKEIVCPTTFDFKYENDFKEIGIKEICYESILEFHRSKHNEMMDICPTTVPSSNNTIQNGSKKTESAPVSNFPTEKPNSNTVLKEKKIENKKVLKENELKDGKKGSSALKSKLKSKLFSPFRFFFTNKK